MYSLNGIDSLNQIVTPKIIRCIVMMAIAGSGAVVMLPAIAQAPSRNISLQMAQTSSIVGNWRLVNMTADNTPTPMVPSQGIELTADFADGRVTGSGGCNRFMGGYELDGDRLTISPLASTFKACEEPIMSQEIRYLNALQGAQRYELDDQEQLTIVYQTEQESGVLRFVSQTVRALW
ncbi:META domain-containing protein [Thermocoleostomius sinensis]|uniref:META domain-containing protein n=1 Tax=Thermocoleostomius sinensis A174 TaxID=2016057 RepID=A0A9E8ZNV7_9CYAN|nr:META domain-containing protein [Thermocoleostomius sinensis]WAL62021.1 META domain-containing protein [Thermocoleostomius sinensis A174]